MFRPLRCSLRSLSKSDILLLYSKLKRNGTAGMFEDDFLGGIKIRSLSSSNIEDGNEWQGEMI